MVLPVADVLNTPQLRWVAGIGSTVVALLVALTFLTREDWTGPATLLAIVATMLAVLATGITQTLRGTRPPE